MKKALTIFLSLFCVFFLGGLRLNDWDFDGYTFIFFLFSLGGSVIITSIIIVKMENNRIIFSSKDSDSIGSDYVRTECKTEILETKEESKKGNVCTSYISMLTIKNGNEKIMSFKKAWDGGINLCFH